jgi:hypothetical protein
MRARATTSPLASAATAFTDVEPMSIPTVTSPTGGHYCRMQSCDS